MFSSIIAFLAGDLFLQTFATLPSTIFIISLVVISFFIWVIYRNRWPYTYLVFAFFLGFSWSAWYAHVYLSWSLPKALEGKPVLVTGYIASLPITDEWQTSFLFALENMQKINTKSSTQIMLKLSWRSSLQPIKVGDRWQLRVRLKRIHGSQNPGAFDFEAWALQKGLRATGYVMTDVQNKLLAQNNFRYCIHRWRQMLQEKIKNHLPNTATSPWLMALIIGEREGIAQEDWQILRNTGTNHLMAIAGLHIGIMAGFAHAVVSRLWCFFPALVLRFPAIHAGACAALITAIFYGALAGFSIPTQRACLMLTVFILALLSRRKINPWHAWSLSLLCVLLLNPLSVLTESFWLSFGTIALIIYGMSGRLAATGLWWKWGRVQWVVGIGLIPFTLALFQQTSLVSFLANSIAIPWLAFLILPFCFLSAIFLLIMPSIGDVCLLLAAKSLSGLWQVLTWFSHLPFSVWQQAMPSYPILIVTIIAILCLLLPSGFPGRWLGLVWLMPLFFYQPERPERGDMWLSLLDVGQGLAVVVQTKAHTLVYDAGPKYHANFDMGESVVLPYLHTLAVKKIDMLVISHGDNDHIGGAPALIKSLPVTAIKTSVPENFPKSSTSYCLAGKSWEWDKVKFTFIYPTSDDLKFGNDSSCVLRIDNGKQRILLTGDIEKYAEKNLLANAASFLPATLLVAPHHGSKTSGLAKFVAEVHPQIVLYAIGYRNRYHFPHASVVAGYEKINAQQFDTAVSGMIKFKFTQNKTLTIPEIYRHTHQRYWMDGAEDVLKIKKQHNAVYDQ